MKKALTQGETLFIAIFIWNMEHLKFVIIPPNTILIHIQDGAIYPKNCIGFKYSRIWLIWTQTIVNPNQELLL